MNILLIGWNLENWTILSNQSQVIPFYQGCSCLWGCHVIRSTLLTVLWFIMCMTTCISYIASVLRIRSWKIASGSGSYLDMHIFFTQQLFHGIFLYFRQYIKNNRKVCLWPQDLDMTQIYRIRIRVTQIYRIRIRNSNTAWHSHKEYCSGSGFSVYSSPSYLPPRGSGSRLVLRFTCLLEAQVLG